MANIGKAIKGLGEGVAAGLQLGQEQKKLKLLEREQQLSEKQAARQYELKLREQQLDSIRLKVLGKQAEVAEIEAQNAQMTGALDVVGSIFGGREDITPDQKDQAVKMFQDKYGWDLESYFVPNKNDEGVVESFSMPTADAMFKKHEQITERIKAQASKLSATSSALQAEIDKIKLERGEIPKTIVAAGIETLYNDPKYLNAPPEQKRVMLSEFGWSLPTSGTKVDKPFGQGASTEIEKGYAGLIEQVSSVEEIAKTQMTDIFTFGGKLKNVWLKNLDKVDPEKLTPEERKWLGDAYVFKANIGRAADQYRVAITGAQAGMKEIEKLESRIFNEKMSPSEFIGLMDYMTDRMKKGLRIKKMLAEEGFNAGDKLFGEKFDKLYMSYDDPTLNKESIDARGDEIRQNYLKRNPKAQERNVDIYVVRQLEKEGYL